ncbi:MAG: hypothetical protein ACXQT4_03015 [Methanotrichaceae archaeon]
MNKSNIRRSKMHIFFTYAFCFILIFSGIIFASAYDASIGWDVGGETFLDLDYYITITAPPDINAEYWSFTIGDNEKASSMSVNASAAWNVTVEETGASTDGKMNTTDGSTALSHPIKINNVALTDGSAVQILYGSSGTNTNYDVTYNQSITWSDSPGTYKIMLKYTGYCIGEDNT